jgi:hypothetical protein
MGVAPSQYSQQDLVDLEQIKALKTRYGALVDDLCDTGEAGARRLGEQIFLEDATVDFTTLSGTFMNGRREIMDHFQNVIGAAQAWMWHGFSNPDITLQGDRATGVWLLYAMSSPKTAPQSPPSITYGRYYDDYVRTPNGWRQSRLIFKNETRTGA